MYENNYVRQIAGVERVDRMKMDDVRKELCIEMCVMERFVKSWMRWEEHVESINIDEDCLPGKMYAHQERERR